MNTQAPLAAIADRKSLADALRILGKVIETKSQHPILSCVLIEAGQDSLTLHGSDLDILASVDLPASSCASRAVAVEFSALKAAVAKAKSDCIHLADVGGAVSFRDGDAGATLRLPGRKAEDYPTKVAASADDAPRFDLPLGQFRQDMARVRVAVSTETMRYYLNGVFFHRADNGGEGVLRMAATDGHRLARIERPAGEDLPADFPESSLPRKTCDALAAVMNKRDGADVVRCAFGQTAAIFKAGRTTIRSKLIDGTFPDYARCIPTAWERTATLPADVLGDAAKSVSGHMTGKTRAIKLSWDSAAGWMTAFGRCPENGPAMIEVGGADLVDTSSEGGAYSIGMNAGYLAQMVAHWDGQPVTMACSDPACPILLTSPAAPEYMQVLMPMRVDGPVITPDYMAGLNRDPVAAFVQDGPALVAAIAEIEADADIPRRIKGRAVKVKAIELAGLIQGAIAHKVVGGEVRQNARLAILSKLAEMRGDTDEMQRLTHILTHHAMGSFRAWSQAIGQPQGGGIVEDQSEAESRAWLNDALAEHFCRETSALVPGKAVPVPEHAAVITSATTIEAAEVIERGSQGREDANGKPMFRTLQDFKAAAGKGSRWSLRNWDSKAGAWGDERFKVVATVRARDVGFVDDGTSPADLAAADVSGFGGRSWIGFPKQGQWDSTMEGLRVLYTDGSPCMMICPAPLVEAGQPNGEGAVLATMAALAARLEALEGVSQAVEADLAPSCVEGLESPPVAALGGNEGCSVDHHALEALIERQARRIERLGMALAGRKQQLARREGELRMAHGRAAQLQRELALERGQPAIIMPVGIRAA